MNVGHRRWGENGVTLSPMVRDSERRKTFTVAYRRLLLQRPAHNATSHSTATTVHGRAPHIVPVPCWPVYAYDSASVQRAKGSASEGDGTRALHVGAPSVCGRGTQSFAEEALGETRTTSPKAACIRVIPCSHRSWSVALRRTYFATSLWGQD